MSVQVVWIVGAILIVAVGLLIGRWVSSWLKYRGERVVRCPENGRPAGVVVNAGHAALSALGKPPEIRLASCSRWPERAGCGQQCLAQVEASPEGCLVRNILAKWYEGKDCASCGRPFGEIDWAGVKPALRTADQSFVEWSQVPAERLEETLATAMPICFACYMANRLVREHPDLAIDRTRPIPH
jgi:hypothetical protein